MIQKQVLELLAKEAPSLKDIEKRELCGMTLQHNPKRAISSGAKVDKASIAKRPCFLCKANRPTTQGSVVWSDDFEILVNPFPILEGHLTIPLRRHEPQQIQPYLNDMAAIAKALPKFILFYNGARCGASAPDHLHFQAVFAEQTPMEKVRKTANNVPSLQNLSVYHTIEDVKAKINSLPKEEDETEPKINLFCNYNIETDTLTFYLFTRKKHRPSIYAEGVMISPGALDMAGILVLPQKNVFQTITEETIQKVFEEV